MTTCPSGHPSGSDDYCDVCGARMTASPTASTGAAAAPSADAGAPGEACPDCGVPRTGRFCEDCGYDFAVGGGRPTPKAPEAVPSTPPFGTPAPAPPGGWTAVVAADRDYYETVLAGLGPDGGGFAFPPYCPERRIPLAGAQIRIGRRSVSQGTVPEIDLGEPPEDPGVSHTHAVLLARPDGGWALVDPGSTNGTTVNGGDSPIAVNVEVPVSDGDRIHVGVWTTITLRKD